MPNLSEINNPLYDELKKEGIYCEEEDYWYIYIYYISIYKNKYIYYIYINMKLILI